MAGCEGGGRDEEWCWDWVTGEGGCRACGGHRDLPLDGWSARCEEVSAHTGERLCQGGQRTEDSGNS